MRRDPILASLEEAVKSAPFDRTNRLVLSDRLEELGLDGDAILERRLADEGLAVYWLLWHRGYPHRTWTVSLVAYPGCIYLADPAANFIRWEHHSIIAQWCEEIASSQPGRAQEDCHGAILFREVAILLGREAVFAYDLPSRRVISVHLMHPDDHYEVPTLP